MEIEYLIAIIAILGYTATRIARIRRARRNAPPWLKEFHKAQDSCLGELALAVILIVAITIGLVAFGELAVERIRRININWKLLEKITLVAFICIICAFLVGCRPRSNK